MDNLLIIGCSNSMGAYNEDLSPDTRFGWCRNIFEKYNYNVDIISQGGIGLEEFLFIINRLIIRKEYSYVNPFDPDDPTGEWPDEDIFRQLPKYNKIIIQLTTAGRNIIPIADGMIYQHNIYNPENEKDNTLQLEKDNKTLRRFHLLPIPSGDSMHGALYNFLYYQAFVGPSSADITLTTDQTRYLLKYFDMNEQYSIERDVNFLYVLDHYYNTIPELKNNLFVFNWSSKGFPYKVKKYLNIKTWHHRTEIAFDEWLESTYGKKMTTLWTVDKGDHLSEEGQSKIIEYLTPDIDNFLIGIKNI